MGGQNSKDDPLLNYHTHVSCKYFDHHNCNIIGLSVRDCLEKWTMNVES